MAYDLIDLKLLVSVADHGTLRQAAAENCLATSSASKRLTNLELSLGYVLFVRHRRGLTLTVPGQIALRHAREVLAQIARLEASLSRN
jgi:DNA-binding transcriptional LysR family regulator